MFNIIKSKRYMEFSAEDQDIIQGGVDLYKHYMFDTKAKTEFKDATNGITYEEHEALYNEALKKESVLRSGISPSGFTQDRLLKNPMVKWAMYELLSETVDTIFPQTIVDDFGRFAEVRNGNFNDNFLFRIPNPNYFQVSKSAHGIRHGQPQRLYTSELILTPVPNSIDIEEDYYAVLSGRSNFGEWMTKVAISLQSQLSIDVYNAMNTACTAQPTAFQIAAGAESSTAVVQMAERVTAANGGSQAYLLGTKTALSSLLPSNDYLKVELGQQMNDLGYLSNFMGIPALCFGNRLVQNDPNFDFAIDNKTIYCVSLGSDKPIKICLEGQTLINDTLQNDHAMQTIGYHIEKSYVVGAATATRIGSIKLS
jgi:hypothetical protein